MLDAVVGFLIRRRVAVMAAVTAATVAATWLAVGIEFDFSPQAVLDSGDEAAVRAERYKATFGSLDATVLVVLEATGQADALSAEAIAWQAEADKRLSQLDGVLGVSSLTDLRLPQLSLLPPFVRRQAVASTGPPGADDEARMRAMVDRLPLVEGGLISKDRRLAAMSVTLDPNLRDIDLLTPAVERVRSALDDLPPPVGCRLHLAGIPVLRVDIVDSLQRDLLSLLPLAAVGFVVVLAVVFRRLSGSLLPLLAVTVGLAWTFGSIVLAGGSLNIVSNVLPILLFVIGMANCVHIVNRYAQDATGLDGPDRRPAVRSTMSHMAMACLLTSLTTAIGFGSLMAARSAVLRSLGWQAMLGMGLLYVSSIVVFCGCLGRFAPPRLAGPRGRVGLTERIVAAGGHFIARRPWRAVAASVLLIAMCLFSARDIVVNSRMTETYDEQSQTMRTLRMIEDRLAGILPLGVVIRADDAGTLEDPNVMRKVIELQQFAERDEQVLMVQSYVDIHRQVLALLPGRAGKPMPTISPGEAGRSQVRLSTAILRALGDESGYCSFVSTDGKQGRILLRLRDAGTLRELELIHKLKGKLAGLFPPGGGVEVYLTDDVYLHGLSMDRFVRDLLWSLGGASVVIFVVIAVLFRSARLGLTAILPNLTPLLITLGYMGLRGYDMNAGNVIVFAISLGIAVDGTIHFMARFREEIQVGDGAAQAIYRSYISTGRAIVLTCVLIVSGLSVLLLSGFLPCRRFAELTGVTMIGALVGDLLLLPACLMIIWGKMSGARSQSAEIAKKQ